MSDQPEDPKLKARCTEIFALMEAGYIDQEIRKKLNMGMAEWNEIIRYSQKNQDFSTEAFMLWEKYCISSSKHYRLAQKCFIEAGSDKDRNSFLGRMIEIKHDLIEVAQKLGVVEPERLILHHLIEEEKDYASMTFEELAELQHEKLNKYDH